MLIQVRPFIGLSHFKSENDLGGTGSKTFRESQKLFSASFN